MDAQFVAVHTSRPPTISSLTPAPKPPLANRHYCSKKLVIVFPKGTPRLFLEYNDYHGGVESNQDLGSDTQKELS